MGYLGCGTVANKIGWALVALLLLVGGIMLAVGLAKAVPCSRTLVACNNAARGAAPAVKACNTAFRDCARTHFIVAGAGLVVAIVGLSIVCCMCCCARRPAPKVRRDCWRHLAGMQAACTAARAARTHAPHTA